MFNVVELKFNAAEHKFNDVEHTFSDAKLSNHCDRRRFTYWGQYGIHCGLTILACNCALMLFIIRDNTLVRKTTIFQTMFHFIKKRY